MRRKNLPWLSLLATASLALVATSAVAQQTEQLQTEEGVRGYDVAARSDRSDTGFGSSEARAVMLLRNAAGKESPGRQLRFLTLERENEDVGDKSLVIFESPRDVEGTALLSHAQILEPDNQWLYLPALKRVKRISSANKSGPFVGSEFAFEDFTATELNKYTYVFLREDELDGMAVDVVERFPRYERSGYTRQISYIDQEQYQLRKVEFFDRKNELLKTLTLTDYRDYGGFLRAHKLSMVNHKTGKETDLVYDAYDFSQGLEDNDFDRGVLTRIR